MKMRLGCVCRPVCWPCGSLLDSRHCVFALTLLTLLMQVVVEANSWWYVDISASTRFHFVLICQRCPSDQFLFESQICLKSLKEEKTQWEKFLFKNVTFFFAFFERQLDVCVCTYSPNLLSYIVQHADCCTYLPRNTISLQFFLNFAKPQKNVYFRHVKCCRLEFNPLMHINRNMHVHICSSSDKSPQGTFHSLVCCLTLI